MLYKALKTRSVVHLANHTDLISKTGGRRHIADSAAPIFDKGKLRGAVLVFRDVTDAYDKRDRLELGNLLINEAGEVSNMAFFKYDFKSPKYAFPIGSSKLKFWPYKGGFPIPAEEWLEADSLANIRGIIRSIFDGTRDDMLVKLKTLDDRYFLVSGKKVVKDGIESHGVFIGGIIRDITDSELARIKIEQSNAMLATFLEQDKIQGDCLAQILMSGDFDSSFNSIAEMLGNYLKSITINISKYNSGDSANLESVALWTSESLQGKDDFKKVSERDFPQIFSHLKSGRLLYCSKNDLENPELSDCRTELRQYFKIVGCDELICVPILRGGQFWGYIGSEIRDGKSTFGERGKRMMVSAARMMEILITQNESRKKLKYSEHEKEQIIDMLPIPVAVLGSDYTLIRGNNAFEKMLKTPDSLIFGMRCKGHICGSNCGHLCPVDMTLVNRESSTFEKDIGKKHYMIKTLPVIAEGNVSKVIVAYIDMTDIAEGRRLLKEAARRAEEAARAKTLFVATMSHEIRTPLNAIIGFSELLKDNTMATPERIDYLNSINMAGSALLNLINDVLDLSKIESGKIKNFDTPVNLLHIFEEMRSIFKMRIIEKNLRFEVSCKNVQYVMMDERHIRQILLNLLGNAVKFTNSGFISISAEYVDNTLYMRVRDSGCGISENYIGKIFEPFEQAESTTLQSFIGTGLGLPIVKRLVEYMGGTVSVESKPSMGSCFTLTFPNVKIGAPVIESKNTAPAVLNGLNAFVVDDVTLNIKVLSAMLKKLGLETLSDVSATRALKRVETEKPSIIFTDLWMPELNGVEFAQKVRKIKGMEKVDIIAVTADNDSSSSFDTSVFNGILLKPITKEQLARIIQSTVGRNH